MLLLRRCLAWVSTFAWRLLRLPTLPVLICVVVVVARRVPLLLVVLLCVVVLSIVVLLLLLLWLSLVVVVVVLPAYVLFLWLALHLASVVRLLELLCAAAHASVGHEGCSLGWVLERLALRPVVGGAGLLLHGWCREFVEVLARRTQLAACWLGGQSCLQSQSWLHSLLAVLSHELLGFFLLCNLFDKVLLHFRQPWLFHVLLKALEFRKSYWLRLGLVSWPTIHSWEKHFFVLIFSFILVIAWDFDLAALLLHMPRLCLLSIDLPLQVLPFLPLRLRDFRFVELRCIQRFLVVTFLAFKLVESLFACICWFELFKTLQAIRLRSLLKEADFLQSAFAAFLFVSLCRLRNYRTVYESRRAFCSLGRLGLAGVLGLFFGVLLLLFLAFAPLGRLRLIIGILSAWLCFCCCIVALVRLLVCKIFHKGPASLRDTCLLICVDNLTLRLLLSSLRLWLALLLLRARAGLCVVWSGISLLLVGLLHFK